MKKHAKLYENIVHALQDEISSGKLLPGDRIPSVVELRERFDVSHITVLRAYQELAAIDLICRMGGKSYRVKAPARPSGYTGTIGCFLRTLSSYNQYDNYFNDITCGVQAECAARRVNWLTHHTTAPLNHLPVPTTVSEEVVEAMVACAPLVDAYLVDEHLSDPFVEQVLERTAKPLVIVNRTSRLPVHTIGPAVQELLPQALDVALRMNYQQFIYMTDRIRISNFERTSEAFNAFMSERKIPAANQARVYNCNLDPHPVSYASAQQVAKNWEKSSGKTLLICESDPFARFIADQWQQESPEIRGKLGLLSTEGLGYCTCRKPFISTLRPNAERLGRLAVEVLLRSLAPDDVAPCNHSPQAEFFLGDTM